jgi:hypothetical protein
MTGLRVDSSSVSRGSSIDYSRAADFQKYTTSQQDNALENYRISLRQMPRDQLRVEQKRLNDALLQKMDAGRALALTQALMAVNTQITSPAPPTIPEELKSYEDYVKEPHTPTQLDGQQRAIVNKLDEKLGNEAATEVLRKAFNAVETQRQADGMGPSSLSPLPTKHRHLKAYADYLAGLARNNAGRTALIDQQKRILAALGDNDILPNKKLREVLVQALKAVDRECIVRNIPLTR